ncbi:CPBP family intramembrane glutamic endopeptidase [Fulvivirga lutea]|uniref:CPBP family intramembrane metalloprotease n=1 Tax=Fulvivirga lutea TaxID=2810512 RepID=A0A974WJR6_9BACT|nr:CPBP family intramembrane glutamic endopeptidase [Fulvivirga lutea]QSE98432.1 CPBP family intramembrane metalloprotease [Fulvivirga lutea]
MTDLENGISDSNASHSITSAFILLILSIIGFTILGPLIGLVISLPFTDASILELQNSISNPANSPDGKVLLYFLQGGATIGMILLPAIYLKLRESDFMRGLNTRVSDPRGIFLSIFITISFMGVNSFFIEWNSELSFPSWMQGFENWARSLEDQAMEMTIFLTNFSSFGDFAIAFIIIAVFPAFAEEYVFRGLLQNRIYQGTGKIHLAIWVSAILFSCIHMQFFGFIPRMLLGAMFGYLYFWSGNFWVPVVAHFTNNGFTLIMIYLANSGAIDYDIQNTESPTLASVGIFTIITVGLVYYFRKLHSN